MKTTVVALCCLTGVVASFAAGMAGGGKAPAPTAGVQSIGVINLVDALQGLAKSKKYGGEFMADRGKARAELDALTKEIGAEEEELTTLKSESRDYLVQLQTVMEKKTRKEFLDRQMFLKQQMWTQKMYGEIVRVTHEVAVEKGLSLVLVKEDPNIPQLEAMPTRIATQKVLYSDGCPDITQEVQARLSAAKP